MVYIVRSEFTNTLKELLLKRTGLLVVKDTSSQKGKGEKECVRVLDCINFSMMDLL
jgi:hypothetical protein